MSSTEISGTIQIFKENGQPFSFPVSKTETNPQPTFPEVARVTIIKEVPSGNIRVESGADGLYLLFDCDCLDALPICKAQCCRLRGIGVYPEEEEKLDPFLEYDIGIGMPVMIRDADGACCKLDRSTCTCTIYSDRPVTCQKFHCTKGATQRGWKLSNGVKRHSES